MSRCLNKLSKFSAAALALGLLAGCATEGASGDLDAVRQDAAAALAAAQEAKAEAEAAKAAAAEAREMAVKAAGLAKAAQFTADRNAMKMERMFKKSMYK